jgi:hypothetical protein
MGFVAFHSDSSWEVNGGPSRVQTPHEEVAWPCGSYSLVARSRLDASQERVVPVTVAANGHAVVTLR